MQVLQGREEEAERGEELHREREAAHAEAAHGEQARVEQRGGHAPLPQHERHEGGQADGERAERERVIRPPLRNLDDAEHDAADREQAQHRAEAVETGWMLVSPSRNHQRCAHEPRDRQHDVEPEERRPLEPLQQQCGDEHADRSSPAGDADPDADGLRSFFDREGGRDDREGRGHDRGRADAHDGAQGDEGLGGIDEGGGRGGEAEDREAHHEDSLAADTVADRARGEQQAGEDDGVGVDDPGELGLARARRAGEARQGDVEPTDRRHDGHERDAHDQQHEAGPARGEGLGHVRDATPARDARRLSWGA